MADANAFHTPTLDEQEACTRLKERFFATVTDPSPNITDSTFLRFYRGMKRKEEAAFEDLLRYQKWRKDFEVDRVDELHKESIEKVIATNVCVFFYDKIRRPSSYNFIRRHKPNERNAEDYRWFIIHAMERVLREADPVEQRGIIVMDLKGFGLSNMDYEVVKLLLSIVQANYPETMHRILIVDAPYIFSACWTVIRPWIDPVTAAKIEFIKRDQLTNFFNSEDLPNDE
jgi:hypothetical protein